MTETRLEWGARGIETLAPWANAFVIVDVLSFTTCVSVAVDQGAEILPFEHAYEEAQAFAETVGARMAKKRTLAGPADVSLSPPSFRNAVPGARYVLPSPNGATLSRMVGETTTYAGCLRNTNTVAEATAKHDKVALIAAGERWPDGSLRPAVEDWLGAGAIAAAIGGTLSAEADIAARNFRAAEPDLNSLLDECFSGRELSDRGFIEDVRYGAALNVSDCAPVLRDGCYVRL